MAFGLSAGTIGAIGSVAAPIVGSMIGADGAKSAADVQAGATDRANAISQQQYQQIRRDNSPFLQNGTSASAKLAVLLGLAGGKGQTPGIGSPEYQRAYQDNMRQFIANGGDLSDPNAERYLQNDTIRSLENGTASGSYGATEADGYGSLNKAFTGAELENEPGYKFGLTQGQQALDNRAAAGGSYFSGAALKGATRYAQDYAGTKYGEAFNRDASQKRQTYDFLSGTANTGLNAANMTGSAGTSMANTVGANTTALGNAMGASQIAQGNALSNGLTNAANGYQQNQLTQAILGGNKGFGTRAALDPYPYG